MLVVDGSPSPSCSGLPRNSSLYSRIMLCHMSKSGVSWVGRIDAGWNPPVGMTLSIPPAIATFPVPLLSRRNVEPARLRRMVSVLMACSVVM